MQLTQDETASRISAEMLHYGIITPEHYESCHMYLQWVYAIGWSARNNHHSHHRAVVQCNYYNGKRIQLYESIAEAARKTGISRRSIINALAKKTNSKKYKWRYATEEEINPL